MGCVPSKTTPAVAFSVPELPAEADGRMRVEECIGGAASARAMRFEWTDSVCPLIEMTPMYGGPTATSPATVTLGHGYSIRPGAKPTGDQRKYVPASGSATLSLANAGRVAIDGPTGKRLCLLKKAIDTQLLKANKAPWEVYERVEKPVESLSENTSKDGPREERKEDDEEDLAPRARRSSSLASSSSSYLGSSLRRSSHGRAVGVVSYDKVVEFDGDVFRMRAKISYDAANGTFSYEDDGALRWVARGAYSRLTPTNPLFNHDGAISRASVGHLTVTDVANGGSVIAVVSGSMKGPKHVTVAKHADVPALLAFALAACFWWDDNKVAQINVASAISLFVLGAG